MRRHRASALVLLAAAVTLPRAAPAQERPTFYVERVSSAIADDEKIGQRRMGVFCIPSGALRWKDVLPSRSLDEREVVEDALEDAGLRVSSESGRPGGTARIKGSVTAANFRVCAKLGAFRDAAVVGDVALDVEWRVRRRDDSDAAKLTSHVARHLASKATIGSAYRDLLTDAARDLAGKLKGVPAN